MTIPAFDYERLHYASQVLLNGVPEVSTPEVPEEVAETIRQVKFEMRGMPAVIADIEAAKRNYAILNRTIDRLRTLAEEAALLTEEDQDGRDQRQAEFVQLAKVMAAVAGENDYSGPRLSVQTKAQAQATQKALRHLTPVKEALAADMREVEESIRAALHSTIVFLDEVARAYPQVTSLNVIPDLLQRVSVVLEACRPVNWVGLIDKSGLH